MEKQKEVDWNGTWTLEDYIFDLFEKKQVESDQFKAMLQIYGREKMTALWRKYQELKQSPLK